MSDSDLVEDGDGGGEPGFDGVRGEDPLSERVERAQRGLVELVEGTAAAVGVVRITRVGPGPQSSRHPLAQLVGRLVREGDGGDRLHRGARQDQCHDPLHQLRRLAGTGPGGDEQGRLEVGGDAAAGRFVSEGISGQGVAVPLVADHGTRARYGASAGSSCLCCHWLHSVAVSAPSGSQYGQRARRHGSGGSGWGTKSPVPMA